MGKAKVQTRSYILAFIVAKLFKDNRLYEREIKDRFGISDRTLRDYFSSLKSLLIDEFFDKERGLEYIIKKASDEKGDPYWYIDKKGNYFGVDADVDEKGDLNLKSYSLDNLWRIIGIGFLKRFLEKFPIKNMIEEIDKAEQNIKGTITYRNDIDSLLKNFDRIFYFLRYGPKEYNGEILHKIVDAIIDKKVIRIRYHGLSSNKEYELDVKPISIIYFEGLLYLLASGAKRGFKDIRTYAIDRIKNLNVVKGRGFHFNYEGFDPARYTNRYVGVIASGKKVRFELIFSGDERLKRLIQERKWFEDQRFEELNDKRLRMTFTAYPTVEVKRWILSYGEDVKVVRPPDFLRRDWTQIDR